MTHQLTGLSSMATRQILIDLAEAYARGGPKRVSFISIGGVKAAQRIRAGEAFDIAVLASDVMAELEAEGHVIAGSCAALARSGIVVAVPAGHPKPNIDDAGGVRAAVLAAKRICYSTGPSGDHLMRLLASWAIAEQVASRLVQAPPGVPVGTVLAGGEADLGFQQRSELLAVPGIEIIGSLPDAIQATTIFTAGICRTSQAVDSARDATAFFTSAEAESAKRRNGMDPI